jgi:hypothetical protein
MVNFGVNKQKFLLCEPVGLDVDDLFQPASREVGALSRSPRFCADAGPLLANLLAPTQLSNEDSILGHTCIKLCVWREALCVKLCEAV